jgi:Pao retrotransposon peptidase.
MVGKLSWDESLPVDLHSCWAVYRRELNCLNELLISRPVLYKDCINVQLHGFSDESENVYGACIYVISQDKSGDVYVNLLCSKTKVAPLKTLTIPKLELYAEL